MGIGKNQLRNSKREGEEEKRAMDGEVRDVTSFDWRCGMAQHYKAMRLEKGTQ